MWGLRLGVFHLDAVWCWVGLVKGGMGFLRDGKWEEKSLCWDGGGKGSLNAIFCCVGIVAII